MKIASLALQGNGSVRVVLEDSLWSGPGKMAESNAEQVETAKQLAASFKRTIATPAEARAILELNGLGHIEADTHPHMRNEGKWAMGM